MATPGWYPDPHGSPQSRFWDGTRWTDQTRPNPSAPASDAEVTRSFDAEVTQQLGSHTTPTPSPQPTPASQPTPSGQPAGPGFTGQGQAGGFGAAAGYGSQPGYGQPGSSGQPQYGNQPQYGAQPHGPQWYGQQTPGYRPQAQPGQGGQPPFGGQPYGTGGGEPPKGNNLPLWIALGVAVALIIGIGAWLIFRPQTTTTPSPTPSVTQTPRTPSEEPSPTPEESTPDPEPTTEDPTPTPTDEPTEPSPEPSTETTPTSNPTTIQVGDVLTPQTCTGAAADARGEVGTDGRVTSGAGLSFPEISGWDAKKVQYPWVYESNSQSVTAGPNWMAALTVGTVKSADGFTDVETTAKRLVECMLGSDFYGASAVSTKVTYAELQSADQNYFLDAEVEITGVEGVTADAIFVAVAQRGDVMHVVVGTAPVDNTAAHDALIAAMEDLSIA